MAEDAMHASLAITLLSKTWLSVGHPDVERMPTLTSVLAPARRSSATFGASFSRAAISSSKSTGARPSVSTYSYHKAVLLAHTCMTPLLAHKRKCEWAGVRTCEHAVEPVICPLHVCTVPLRTIRPRLMKWAWATCYTLRRVMHVHLNGQHAHVVEVVLHIVSAVVFS